MNTLYQVQTHPFCSEEAVLRGDKYRISILTPWLIRLEYNENGKFEDHATQCVWNRKFPVPEFQVFDEKDNLQIVTSGIRMLYDKKRFSRNGLSLEIKGKLNAFQSIWHYGDEVGDLRGTARTLDGANGSVELEHGLISREGYAVLDDSRSHLMTEDGWVAPRQEECIDIYFFGYGHQYEKCLQDFYRLTGNVPLLPRYTLGNWWSRYHKYSEEEYKELITRFEREEIPFSVAVIDMDWHLVDINPKYGNGWTGYTWNSELFPNPERFMSWLHEHNLKVTLNVHPADGVRPHEEQYEVMAKALGIDYEQEEYINFDVTNPEFLDAYFKYLHHPNEEKGVDFWWLDWQQGGVTRIPGLDPLWMLNHYHYLDSQRRGNRGLTFSRYAGLGSHRYPIGFSGDTIITWESLEFQPYFTANASNAGYGWWSHDIGGHTMGYKDDELATRWVQLGVFSPIMRLHSSCNHFSGKEPWKYNMISEHVMKRFLKLRHELVPYLYTMNYYASRKGQPLIRPMYYPEPERNEAYDVPNEYYFGTEMIACPITRPVKKLTQAASVEVWLPEGMWFDIFNGRIYDGGRKMILYRGIEEIPVLAKAGGIIPMHLPQQYTNSIENPRELCVKIFPGGNGEFHLYEDDGNSMDTADHGFADTVFTWNYEGESRFVITPPAENIEYVPKQRSYQLEFYGIQKEIPEVFVNGEKIEAEVIYCEEKNIETVKIPEQKTTAEIEVRFPKQAVVKKREIAAQIFEILYKAEIEYDVKERLYQYVLDEKTTIELLTIIQTMNLDRDLTGMLMEVLLA